MGYHPFHMFCRCVDKVWQGLGHSQYTMILFIQASEHPSYETRFGENFCRSTKPSSGWCVILSEEAHDMDVLPPYIPYFYGCMGKVWQVWDIINTQGCWLSKPTEHPSCGTRFGEKCSTTLPSSGWCILLHEEQHAMDVLLPIPHILWVHVQGLARPET